MDARLGWMISRSLEVGIVGQNLLHTSHFETNDSTFTPATKVKRGEYLSVTWKF